MDTILTKDFWRASLEAVDARVPRELGRWADNKLTLFHDLNQSDLVIKVPDSYLGIGDSFWNYGTDYLMDADKDSKGKTLQEMLDKNYDGQEVLVLELVRPAKHLGVHSLDILTIRTPDDDVKVLSVILWDNCTTSSSHSCQEGYMVDVETEEVVSAAAWYCAAFSDMNTPRLGQKFPGVKKVCMLAAARCVDRLV